MDFIGKVLGIGSSTSTVDKSTEDTSNIHYNNSGQNLKPANSTQMAPPMVSKQNVSKQMTPPMVSKQNVSKQMAPPMGLPNRTASSKPVAMASKPVAMASTSKLTGGYRKKSRSRSKKSKSKKSKSKKTRSRRH